MQHTAMRNRVARVLHAQHTATGPWLLLGPTLQHIAMHRCVANCNTLQQGPDCNWDPYTNTLLYAIRTQSSMHKLADIHVVRYSIFNQCALIICAGWLATVLCITQHRLLQRVATCCCSVLRCVVAACCNVLLQRVAMCCNVSRSVTLMWCVALM